MKRNVFKILYVVLLLAMIFLAVKGFTQGKGTPEEIAEKLVIVEDAKILEENEGKLVLISGKMETDTVLEFEDEGVKVNTPILKREVEMYIYERDEDDYDRVVRIWSKESPENGVLDKKLNKNFYNPTKDIDHEEKYSDVQVGDFTIASKVIKNLKLNAVVSDFSEISGLRVENETILTTAEEGNFEIGDYRMQYFYLDLSNTPEYTFIGKQKDGNLEEYKLDTGKGILQKFEGNLTKEEALEELTAMGKRGNIAAVIIVVVLLVFGVFIFKPKKEFD